MQDEFAFIDGAVQLVEHTQSPPHRAGQRRFPHFGAVGAAHLGFLQCHIQVPQHIIVGAVGPAGDQMADIRGQPDPLFAGEDRGRYHLQQPPGE